MSSAADPGSGASTRVAPTGLKGTARTFAAASVGILLTGAIAGGVLISGGRSPPAATDASQISSVDPVDLAAAGSTLTAENQAALIAEAKACRAPLAVLTLSRAAGADGGVIRIRSGSYLSPAFRVGDAPQRIAIPFPAPYAAGRGTLSVEGEATGVQLTLFPTWSAATLTGKGAINLVWHTDKPCGA
jgi:hypothetical protein